MGLGLEEAVDSDWVGVGLGWEVAAGSGLAVEGSGWVAEEDWG